MHHTNNRAIIIPTYINHFHYIENLLKSINTFVLDIKEFDICFILSSKEEKKLFDKTFSKYRKKLSIFTYNIEDILSSYGISISSEILLKDIGKYSYQTIKKLYGIFYLQYNQAYIMDSESLFICQVNVNSLFEDYFRNPFVLYFPFSCYQKQEIDNSLNYITLQNVANIFNEYKLDNFYFDGFNWFYDINIVNDMFKFFNNDILGFCGVYLYYGEKKFIKVNDVPQIPDSKLLPNKFTDEYQNTAWRKLYHKSLFEKVSFPVGLLHEDIGFWFGIMSNYKKIATINKPLYFYRKNNLQSITLSKIAQKKRCFDGLRSFEFGLKYVEQCQDELYLKKLINAFVNTYNKFPFLLNNEEWLKEQHEFLSKIAKYKKLLTLKNRMALSRLYCPNFIKLDKHFHRLLYGKLKDKPRELISTISYLFRSTYTLFKEIKWHK